MAIEGKYVSARWLHRTSLHDLVEKDSPHLSRNQAQEIKKPPGKTLMTKYREGKSVEGECETAIIGTTGRLGLFLENPDRE